MADRVATEPTVSVVIPVAGGAADLAVQLASVAAQTDASELEVVVADNGAGPDVAAVIDAFAAVLPGLRRVDASDRRGASYARNVGARASRGRYLLFVDGDDEMAPGYVAALVAALGEHELVTGQLDMWALNRALPEEYVAGAVQQELPTSYGHLPFAAGCSLGMSRELFDLLDGFDEDIQACEDVDVCWRAQYLGKPLVRVDEAVLRYRLRPGLLRTFRQGAAHAADIPALYQRHRDRGMPRREGWTVLRYQFGVLKTVARTRSPGDMLALAYRLGARWGLLVGSLRHRVRYL